MTGSRRPAASADPASFAANHAALTAQRADRAVILTLLVRAYCHLCDEMRHALQPIAAQAGLAIAELDVDADPALEARWGDAVPVLLAGERELCRYRLDRGALEAFLAGVARDGDLG